MRRYGDVSTGEEGTSSRVAQLEVQGRQARNVVRGRGAEQEALRLPSSCSRRALGARHCVVYEHGCCQRDLLTDTQIAAAATRGDAVEIANPAATFHCAKVSNRIWDLGTPVTPFTG